MTKEIEEIEKRVKNGYYEKSETEIDCPPFGKEIVEKYDLGQAINDVKTLLSKVKALESLLAEKEERINELGRYKDAWGQLFAQLCRDRATGFLEKTARAWLLMQEFEERIITSHRNCE